MGWGSCWVSGLGSRRRRIHRRREIAVIQRCRCEKATGVGAGRLGHRHHTPRPSLVGVAGDFEAVSRSCRAGRLRLGLLPGLRAGVEERCPTAVAERVPVDGPEFIEIDQQHVQQALRLRATVIGAGQDEAAAPNLVGVFAGPRRRSVRGHS
jgi:hypothetical protein